MKKKFLSLMMAAAMVATTSVSAFAEQFDIQEGSGKDINVKITGNVENQLGAVVPGTVSVTVPTAAVFNVKHDSGSVVSGEMSIINHSDEEVLVFASEFVDTTGDENIKLVKENEATSSTERKNVFLKLVGGDRTVFFTSEEDSGKRGKIYDATTNQKIANNTEIGRVSKDNPLNLRLEGQGGTNETASTPIKDDFKLVLKIKKVK